MLRRGGGVLERDIRKQVTKLPPPGESTSQHDAAGAGTAVPDIDLSDNRAGAGRLWNPLMGLTDEETEEWEQEGELYILTIVIS